MADIKRLIEQLYSGALFLQNRANAATEDSRNELLNDMDIECLHDISKICCEAAGELEKAEKEATEYPFKCKVGNNSEIHSKSIQDYDKLIADISAEAIIEFATRLILEAGYFGRAVAVKTINDLVHEMIGGADNA